MTEKRDTFYIPSLDGLRTLSILAVFIGHTNHILGLDVGGGFGVTIFFFISGYLITTLLRQEYETWGKIALQKFYLRRIFKILPPMYFSILFGVTLITTGLITSQMTVGGITAAVLFSANYWRAAGHTGIPEPMFVLWSLAVEEHFYLLFPLLYIGLRKIVPKVRYQVAILVSVCIGVLLWRSYLHFHAGLGWQSINVRTDTRLDGLLWGCVLAIAFNPMMDPPRGPDYIWKWVAAPIGVGCILVSSLGAEFESHIGYTLQSIGIGLVLVAVIRFPTFWAFRPLNWHPIAWLGKRSYSFYLIHYYILWSVHTHVALNGPIQTTLAFVITVIASAIMYRHIEIPFAKMRNQLSRRNRAANPEVRAVSSA